MTGWIQDLKYAVRSLSSAPRFAAIVVATLALGIGANTAVFGVLNAVVLQPLPYDESDRLVRVYMTHGEGDQYWPGPAVVNLRDCSQTVDVAAMYLYGAGGRGPHRSRAAGARPDSARQRGLLPRATRAARRRPLPRED